MVAPHDDQLIVVGQLGAPHGLKGWLRLISSTQPSENIFEYLPWYIKPRTSWQVLVCEARQRSQRHWIIKLEGVNDRDEAARFTNQRIYVEREVLPALDEEDYYWSDLEGLEVINQQSIVLGHIDQMLETGANDVMVVKCGKVKRLIPYLYGHVVKKVDLERKQMMVDWDESFD